MVLSIRIYISEKNNQSLKQGRLQMSSSLQRFEHLLYTHLIPEFCADSSRKLVPEGFQAVSQTIDEIDAQYFLKAWDNHLIKHIGRGQYRTPQSGASEQFFWEGSKKIERLRKFTLWKEPIITIGGIARLHFDYGWPIDLIATQSKGTQSTRWAFDLVTYLEQSNMEIIAGEVKKTKKEIDTMLDIMKNFPHPSLIPDDISKTKKNALKKLEGLRRGKASFFWALGPSGYSRTFLVNYSENDYVTLKEINDNSLRYASSIRGVNF